MASKEDVFSEESDASLEPMAFVLPTISTVSITDLPSTKPISCCAQFSGIIYALTASLLSTCAIFLIIQLGVDLVDALLFRFTVQVVLTLIFALYKQYELFPGTMSQRFLQILCCATGAGGYFIYFSALRYVQLSDATTLFYTRVIWTVIFSIFMYRERPSISLLLALPLTLIGVVFVMQPSFLFSSAISSIKQSRVLGFALSIISSFASATSVLSFKQLVSTSKQIKPSVINLQYSSALLTLLVINQFYQKFILHAGITLTFVLSWRCVLASLVCLALMLTNILTQKAIKREHPAVFTLLGSADIIFSVILQNIFTSKRSNFYALLGSTLVICSVVIIGISRIITDRYSRKDMKLLDDQLLKKDLEEKC